MKSLVLMFITLSTLACTTTNTHILTNREQRLVLSGCLWGEVDFARVTDLPFTDEEYKRMQAACLQLVEDVQK